MDILEREDVLGNVRRNEPLIKARLESMRELPFVGDVRGAGHFWAIELVKDKETKEQFDADDTKWLIRDALTGEMSARGLLCRLDDKSEPVIQISPPLIADMDLINEILDIISAALTHAGEIYAKGRHRRRRRTP